MTRSNQFESESIYKSIVNHMYDGVYFVDKDRRITYWNQAAERISGYSASEVVGSRCKDNILSHTDLNGHCICESGCPLQLAITQGISTTNAEVFLHHKQGHRVPVNVRGRVIKDEQGQVIGAVEVFNDNTACAKLREQYKELEQRAYIDPLTELPNRRYIDASLEAKMSEIERFHWQLGVLFFDIDHFKNFNDTYGHDTGDKVLKTVGHTLIRASRALDIVGRWGGEEFLMLAPNITGENLIHLAERFRAIIEQSFIQYQGQILRVSASIGATLSTAGDTAKTLVTRADTLLYQSKDNGRNCVTCDLAASNDSQSGKDVAA